MLEAYWWWLAVAVVAVVAEVASFSLVTVWFVVGALVAFAAAFVGAPLWLQLVLFVVVSVLCLVLLRPLAMKSRLRGSEYESTPVGQQARVVERIDPKLMTGRVETPDRMTWAAVSKSGEAIEVGEQVMVVAHESVKLIVERTKS